MKDSSLGAKFGSRKGNRYIKHGRRMLFQGLEFLLTGFSSLKTKELETLIRKHGGDILFDVPSPSAYSRRNRESSCKNQQLPIVLSAKKVSALELTSAFYFFIC